MIENGIFWAFAVALIADIISNNLSLKPQSVSHLLLQPGLVYLTGLLIGLIYLIDTWNGDYFWWAFIIVFCLLIGLDILLHKRLIKKVIHIIGCFAVMGIILYIILYTRYELQTRFFKPCWSSDGNQIAFFMEKALYRYYPSMFSFSSPDDIWKKYYLCTMDYDGKNFKQIKQTEQATDEISWSGSGNIVYTQDIRLNVDVILQRKIIYTSVDGKETGMLYETAKIPTNDVVKGNERILDPWLSKDKRYLGFVLNYREPRPEEEKAKYGYYYENYRMVVKDFNTQQNVFDFLQKDVKYSDYNEYFGSYGINSLLLKQNDELIEYNLETRKSRVTNIKWSGFYTAVPSSYSCIIGSRSYSPDHKMYAEAGGVWSADNKVVSNFYIKPKRSYLFNIFPK